ncbi:MAG: diguanylate cyclase, partial [Oscillospiraceae bacterium]
MLDNFKRAIKYSYAKKLLLLVSIITICIFIAFDIVVISLSNSYLTNQVVGQINTISKETSAVLDNFMTAKIQSLNQIAAPLPIRDFLTNVKSKNEIKSNTRYTAVNGILNSSLKIDEDFSSTWIVSDTGNFKYSSDYLVSSDDFNIKTQPWYSTLSTVTDEDYIWFSSVPTKSSNNNEPYFTIVTPVFENSNIVGYAGADVNFSNLTKMFEKFEFIDGTKTAIISNDGTGIYVKNDDNFFNTFTDEHDTISLSLRTYLRTGEKSYKLDSFNPNSNYVSFQKNNLTAWNVMVFCDGYSVFHDRNVLSLTIVLLTACAAALIIIFVYRRILLSISDVPKIIKVIDDVNNGIYTSKIGSASSDEFGQIANAIDNMSTDLQNRIEVIENYAYYDQLTELPNQNKMYEVLGEFITYAFDHSGKFALVFLDINNFKWINDTLGHNFGDEFLKVFSKCIKETLDEYGVVSRFSGDKFVLLIPFSGENEILSEYITKIQNKFQQPIVVCGDQIFVRFSVGVAVYPDDGANSELLLRNADIAMNISKENGYNVIEYYNNNLHKSVLNKALISQNLVNALDNGELFLNYQPILTTQNREIHGFEVLLRWTNDK